MEDFEHQIERFCETPITATDHNDSFNDYNNISNELLYHLFMQKKYVQILNLTTPHKFILLPPNIRLFYILSLFQLGRRKSALRELAVAIETECDPNQKKRLLWYEREMLQLLGLRQRAEICLYESNQNLGVSSSVDLIELSDEVTPPIQIQAKNYLCAYSDINEVSLGKLSIEVAELIDLSVKCLGIKSEDPLQYMFKAASLFGPDYLYSPIEDKKSEYLKCIKSQFDKYNLHPLLELDSILETLERATLSTMNSLEFITNIVTKLQISKGLVLLYCHEYLEASFYFLWVTNFLDLLHAELPFCINKSGYVSEGAFQANIVFLCRCIEFGDLDQKISECVTGREPSSLQYELIEFFPNRLSTMMLGFGEAYRTRAEFGGTEFEIDDMKFLKYDSSYLYEALQRLVVANASRAQDDPKLLVLIDRILFSFMMHGGLHLGVYWFFRDLRNIQQLHLDLGPICCPINHNYKLFLEEYILAPMQDIMMQLDSAQRTVGSSEKEDMWNIDLAGIGILAPYVFECKLQEKFYMMSEICEENQLNLKYGNLQLHRGMIKRKVRSSVDVSHQTCRDSYSSSIHLIRLWADTYLRFHEELPPMVANLCSEYMT